MHILITQGQKRQKKKLTETLHEKSEISNRAIEWCIKSHKYWNLSDVCKKVTKCDQKISDVEE